MKVLLDTHILLWAAAEPERLSAAAHSLLDHPETEPVFSPASIWEVAIKRGLGRADFQVDPVLLRRGLLDNGYAELPITSEHAARLASLPPLHKDPFDRMLVAPGEHLRRGVADVRRHRRPISRANPAHLSALLAPPRRRPVTPPAPCATPGRVRR